MRDEESGQNWEIALERDATLGARQGASAARHGQICLCKYECEEEKVAQISTFNKIYYFIVIEFYSLRLLYPSR